MEMASQRRASLIVCTVILAFWLFLLRIEYTGALSLVVESGQNFYQNFDPDDGDDYDLSGRSQNEGPKSSEIELGCFGIEFSYDFLFLKCETQEECLRKLDCLHESDYDEAFCNITAEELMNGSHESCDDINNSFCLKLTFANISEFLGVVECTCRSIDNDTTQQVDFVFTDFNEKPLLWSNRNESSWMNMTIKSVTRNNLTLKSLSPNSGGENPPPSGDETDVLVLYENEEIEVSCGCLKMAFYDNILLTTSYEFGEEVEFDEPDETALSYTISTSLTITEDMRGFNCSCQIYDSTDLVTTQIGFEVEVGSAPSVDTVTTNMTIIYLKYEEKNPILPCNFIVGKPIDAKLNFIWYHNDTQLSNDSEHGWVQLTDKTFDHDRDLNITELKLTTDAYWNINRKMEGMYRCYAENFAGNASAEYEVKLNDSVPVILEKLEEGSEKMTTVPGDKAGTNLTCTGHGIPIPLMTWVFNGMDISNYSFTKPNDEEYYTSNSTLNWSLVFDENNFDEKDRNFTCLATNSLGRDTLIFHINLNGTEENPSTTSAPSEEKKDEANKIILIVAITVTLISTLVGLGSCLKNYFFSSKEHLHFLTDEEVREFNFGIPPTKRPTDPIDPGAWSVKQFKNFVRKTPFGLYDYEIPVDELIVEEDYVLGEGEFGRVTRGQFKGKFVAIKKNKRKREEDKERFKALLLEVKIMALVGEHANIVKFLGASTLKIQEGLIYVVMELCTEGNLQNYLINNRLNFVTMGPYLSAMHGLKNVQENVLTTVQLTHFCAQIASGMKHLASKQVIHGDLATRNVLVFPNDVVKITDFGLSRHLPNAEYADTVTGFLPWRWTALETLFTNQFSCKSDTWSYGVTMWEIFCLGDLPYPRIEFYDELVNELMRGRRLSKPDLASKEIYALMRQCWYEDPQNRPSFDNLEQWMNKIWQQQKLVMTTMPNVSSNFPLMQPTSLNVINPYQQLPLPRNGRMV